MRIALALIALPVVWLSGCGAANPPGAVQVPPPTTSGAAPLPAQAQPANPLPAASGFPSAAAIPTTSAAPSASTPATIPDSPVAGKIHGRDFAIEKVVFENGVLTLRQGKDYFPDLALDVMMFIRQGESLAGKQVKITPGQTTGIPLLRLQWRESGKGLPETENFSGSYTLVLEFGQVEGNKVPGRIFVALPDQAKSTLSGKFEVEGAK